MLYLRASYRAENITVAFDDFINRANLIDHITKHIEQKRLWSVAERAFRIRMHIYEQSVCAGRHARARHWNNRLTSTC